MKGNTLNVMFFILKNKLLKNGEAPVVLRVTINGQRDEIRIQRSIPVELWDNAKMRSKGRGRSSAELNMYLETLRDRIYVIHRNSVYDGERLTPKKILDILYVREGRHLVLKAMKECIDGWAASPGDLHPATLARYNRCHGLVETVIRDVYNKEDVAFSELDRKFITAFERYLKETCGLAWNTAAKYLECFRKVLKVAQQKGWMEHGKFLEELGQLCVKEETSPSFLGWDELRTVMETDMKAGRLERVKDVFVFCALTGLSYQGISTLCPLHLFRDDEGTLWICRTRAEGAEVGDSCTSRVPLLKPAMVLLEKYRGWNPMNPEGPCFPVPSVQKMNEYLKEVAARCRISKRLTTQMARNTFAATVTLASRIPKEHVREMLGYSSDYMLRHYMQAQERNS